MKQQPLDPYLKLHGKANLITTPAFFKRGIISLIHISSATADVLIVGNLNTTLKNIPLSSAIVPSTIKQGDKCLVFMFDEANPNDCIIVCAYGRDFWTSAPTYA